MSQAPSTRHMVELDALRFLAALLVCVYHLGYAVWADPRSGLHEFAGPSYRFPELQFLSFGWVGVQVFFVISGMVIAASAEAARPAGFLLSRARRLFPAVWICATVSMGLALYFQIRTPDVLWGRYLNSITLLPSYPYIEGVYWTLQVEIYFYAAVAAFCYAFGNGNLVRLAHALAVASAAYLICEAAGVVSLPKRIENTLLLQHGALFALGMYLHAWSRGRLGIHHAAVVAIAMAGSILSIRAHAQDVLSQSHLEPSTLYAALPYLAWVASLVACIMAVARPIRPPRSVASALRTLGLASYPLYLVHYTLGVVLTKAIGAAGGSPAAGLAMATATACGLSIVIALYAEPWIRSRTFGRLPSLRVVRRQAASIAEPS